MYDMYDMYDKSFAQLTNSQRSIKDAPTSKTKNILKHSIHWNIVLAYYTNLMKHNLANKHPILTQNLKLHRPDHPIVARRKYASWNGSIGYEFN